MESRARSDAVLLRVRAGRAEGDRVEIEAVDASERVALRQRDRGPSGAAADVEDSGGRFRSGARPRRRCGGSSPSRGARGTRPGRGRPGRSARRRCLPECPRRSGTPPAAPAASARGRRGCGAARRTRGGCRAPSGPRRRRAGERSAVRRRVRPDPGSPGSPPPPAARATRGRIARGSRCARPARRRRGAVPREVVVEAELLAEVDREDVVDGERGVRDAGCEECGVGGHRGMFSSRRRNQRIQRSRRKETVTRLRSGWSSMTLSSTETASPAKK